MASIATRGLLVAAPFALLAAACGSATGANGGKPDASMSGGDANTTGSGSGSGSGASSGTGSGSGGPSGTGSGTGGATGTGSGTGDSTGTGSGTGSASGTGSGTGSSTGTGSGTGSSTGTGSGTGSSSGTGSGSGSHLDAGGAGDAGAWSVGSGASNPGYATCGSTQCSLTNTICCLSSVGGPSCIAPGEASQCPGEWTIACDEPQDCPAGSSCGVAANFPLETVCTSTSGWPRICKDNADCGDAGGGVCVMHQSCDGHRVYVSTCGVDQWCAEFP